MNVLLPIKVRAVGPNNAKIMIVGEAPGATEEKQGVPFVGQSGQLLRKLLKQAGIVIESCYITNVVKVRPHKNDIKPFVDLGKKYPIESESFLGYVDHLAEEIRKVDPNVIVAVGNVPLWALCRKKGATKWRGSVIPCELVEGYKVIPIIHPAAALPNRKFLYQYHIAFDLHKVRNEQHSKDIKGDENEYIVRPTYKESIDFLNTCLEHNRVAFDIEVMGTNVSCISFSYQSDLAISIPFFSEGTNYYNREEEREIWRLIIKQLQDPNIESVGHNVTFDGSFLLGSPGIIGKNLQDTMVACGILHPKFEKSLAFVTSIYTNVAYYKDEGKEKFKGGEGVSDDQFWLYNAKDSIVLMQAFPKMLKELVQTGNLMTYVRQAKLIEPLLFISEGGIAMDVNAMAIEEKEVEKELKGIEDTVVDIVGDPINLRSPAQLKDYFYNPERGGYKPVVDRKTGKPTTNEAALKILATRGSNVAQLLLEYRRRHKYLSTYLKMGLDDDRRIRCSMNPVGTISGRLSSSKTIFGKGANMQNQPKSMKKFMLVDEGYVGFEIDLGQAENRVVAYLGQDERMIHAFENEIDIHSQTAGLLFNKPVEEVSRKAGSSSIGNGTQSERYWGKKANHGLNYGLGYFNFAKINEIPNSDARFLVQKYHTAYPGVKRYHDWVKDSLRKSRALKNPFGRIGVFRQMWGDELFKLGYSFVPQSTVADKINQHGVIPIYYDQDKYYGVRLLNQIHDSVVFEIKLEYGWEYIAQAVLWIKESLEQPLEVFERSFSIPADVKIVGRNFDTAFELGKKDLLKEGISYTDLFSSVSELAKFLEAKHESLCQ